MIQDSQRLPASALPALAPLAQPAESQGGQQALSLLRGEAARQALAGPMLQAGWQALLAQCPAATVFQAPGFVMAWYATYAQDWEPVVLISLGDAGELRGLWTLAWHAGAAELSHAGAYQAEYHGWLALPDRARFVNEAWRVLRQAFPLTELRFRYLPDRRMLDALAADPWLAERLRWRAVARPLMRLDAEEIRKSMAKKSNKSRLNRLKRLGALAFRPVVDAAELERVLPALMASYDFRQAAVNDTSPFREDPRKEAFHRALFAAGSPTCHLTVSSLDEAPIAAFWGAASGSMLHLGMLIHSPTLAEHSPGKLHLQHLAEALLGSDVHTIDLTPGGDAWKERFANAHDEVYELSLFAEPGLARRHDRRGAVQARLKAALARVSLRPAQVRTALQHLRRLRPSALAHRLRSWTSEQRELRIYRMTAAEAKGRGKDARVASNDIPALLSFEPGELWQTRQGFLSAALARLEAGERAYTISIGGRLAHSGWLVAQQRSSRMSEVDQTLHLPANSAVLYDFYTDPACRGQGLYPATLDHMLAEAFADPGIEYAYINVLADNIASRKVIERAGFQYLGSFHWRRSLGRRSTSADPCFAPAAAAPAAEEPDASA